MNAKDLARNNRSDGETVECVDERLPDLDIAPSLALVVKAVDPRDIGAFVVASEEEEILWVLELVAEKEQYRLERLLATVDVISQEQEVCAWWKPAHLKHSDQVGVLAVDVTDNLDGSIQFEKGGLGKEAFPGTMANGHNFGILKTHTLGNLARVRSIQQPLDEVVKVNVLDVSHSNSGSHILLAG